jgi:hypothetical protein
MLTQSQVIWAKRHDWFLRDNADGTITVLDFFVVDGELHSAELHWTSSFAALRNWAGY